MDKTILKVIIAIGVIVAIIIGTMYLIDSNKMKKGEEVVFSTWGAKYAPVLKIEKNENDSIQEQYQKYTKTIDNVKIALDIPNDWKYEEMPKDEENDRYKYALKLYKNNEEQYAILYFYNKMFGVCGTGRTDEVITLNNGEKAVVGYYDGWEEWSDISFYEINEMIAVMNYGLTNNDAEEVVEFIKTINITNII